MATERCTRRRPRQLGLEAASKGQVAQQVAHVVALSLQQTRLETDRATPSAVAPKAKQGLLASTLRLAARNASNMAEYLRRRQAEASALVITRREQFERGSTTENDHVCVICLDGDATDSRREVEALPCGHVFHARCIAQWLLYTRVCPVDRRPVD